MKIIRTIKERDMVPCIIFSFSRKECEAYATQLKDVDFNDGQSVPFVIFKSVNFILRILVFSISGIFISVSFVF